MENLSSIRLQEKINLDMPDLELWCPVLKFGKKKSSEYKFPIVFKNRKAAEKLYDELEKLIGKPWDEVKAASEILYPKFKKYHYLAVKRVGKK